LFWQRELTVLKNLPTYIPYLPIELDQTALYWPLKAHIALTDSPRGTRGKIATHIDYSVVKMTTWATIRNALGLLFEADDPPTEEDCQTPGKFVNRCIAFKWAAKKCGGWHLGKIEEQEDDGVTYVATYASDGATGQHELPFALHTTVTKMLHIPACLHHAHMCMRLCRLKQSPCICVLRKPRHVSAAGCC
jgi:hypothetical protein